ncbi:MAG: ABC transporter ATP-binding protein, partial [Clostridia bacterium]|nr:ABC transporter ATP-binding protein [Clostridia bacterium]
MLEVVNLTKIYSTKTSDEVKALDGVSLRFPERGMVFLLGKSGSGKSTLLNLCGGLDAPTSGEIIVKGRSSKDFSQSDFDSYRNTFVGFVFQEYNILNEFSVEDNVSLALELQGKPKDRKTVNDLLKQVDLEGYAKRKPNTLSGGQKQRIAIARALVKSPEIIMADEPTGALDSATGKQVFDTLKKLSKDKLVLVVSHDREFAEQYGDRVIELMDGKVISDVSKEKEAQTSLSE